MYDHLAPLWPMPALAFGSALVLVLLCGPLVIRLLAARCRETIRQDSPRLAELLCAKAATPSMGGVLILGGFLIATGLLSDVSQVAVQAAILLALGFAAIGVWDDLSKRRTRRRGITARTKLAAQIVVASLVVVWLDLEGGWIGRALAVLLIVGMSNAVNLADGLDGLAGGLSLLALAAMALIGCCLADASDVFVPIAALAGSVLGFLWFNRQPARVFMGDTGSLPLGGLLGLFVVLLNHPLALLLVCGVFLIEAASVVVQVGWFRCTGRRVFLCAPLHHHFQFLGWPERRIVRGFWLAGVLCSLVGLGTLLALNSAGMP